MVAFVIEYVWLFITKGPYSWLLRLLNARELNASQIFIPTLIIKAIIAPTQFALEFKTDNKNKPKIGLFRLFEKTKNKDSIVFLAYWNRIEKPIVRPPNKMQNNVL